MKFSEMSDETIERANELLDEYINVLSDIYKKSKNYANFDKEALQKEFDNYIVNIDGKTQLDKKKIAIVVFQLNNIERYRGTLAEQIEFYCYDLIEYKSKLEEYLMYGVEVDELKNDNFNANEYENIEKFHEKYGKDLVDGAEKKIKEYPDYLVLGSIFSKEELPYISEKFSEGNSEYAKVLYNLNLNGLYTFSGCIGHDEFDQPYVAFKIPENNPELFYNFLYQFNKGFNEHRNTSINFLGVPERKEDMSCTLYCDSIENRDEFYSEILTAIEFAKSNKDIVYDDKYEKSCNLIKKVFEETNSMLLTNMEFNYYANPSMEVRVNSLFSHDDIYKEQNKNVLNIYSNIQTCLYEYENIDIDFLSQKVDDIIEKSNDEEITIPSIPQLGMKYTKLVEEENFLLEQNGYSLESLADNDKRLIELGKLQDSVLKQVDFFYLDRIDEFFDFIDDCIQNRNEEEK